MKDRKVFGFKRLVATIRKCCKTYYRYNISGLENIPDTACLLVGNHNAIGIVNPEIWIFGSEYFSIKNNLKVLGHDLVLRIPGLRWFASTYLKYIPNNHQSAKDYLKNGHHVLVYPGGGWESSRPYLMKDEIDFKGRTGFVKLAREANVPIVPVVSIGAHSGIYIVSRGEKIAKFLKLDRYLRIDTFPLGFSFPCIFHIGPFMPFFPLPRKCMIKILPPIEINHKNSTYDAKIAQEIINSMQLVLSQGCSSL